MTPEALTALKGSIAKWQRIVDGTDGDCGTQNCPLCRMFRAKDCDGCPVKDRTSKPYCDGTPYDDWDGLDDDDLVERDDAGFVNSDKSKAIAQAELDFLKSLLPEGEAA